MTDKYDVVVIGGGPAGYVAAIRCAQLGLNTACVDEWVNADGAMSLGGTCVNVGCIPSKALLESSEAWAKTQHEWANHGIRVDGAKMDIEQMHTRRREIVKSLTGGVAQLFKSNGVTGLHGHGKLVDKHRIEVSGPDGDASTIEADSIILASGSQPVDLKVSPIDGDRIVDSAGALEFDAVPKRLGVIGGGVIGLELGSVWARLGSEVVILEAMDDFLSIADRQIAKEAHKQFKKQGLDIRLGARVTGSKASKKDVTLTYEDANGGDTLKFDKLIVCVGRRPNTDNLFSEEPRIELDEKGFIEINDQFRTNLPHVYAIGDVVRGPMLAHKASEEGVAVAEIIAGQHGHVNYNTVPSVIYTWPEVAWVGKTEEELKSAGIDYRTGSFSFAANGRAKAMEAAMGLTKFIADAHSDEILGIHIVGPGASELIAEGVLAMEYRATSEDVARTMHAHPTLSETMHEAALAVDGRMIHGVNRKRK